MGPSLVSLSCPNCAGMLEVTTRPDLFKCAHCRHLAVLSWPQAGPPQVTRLEEKKSWRANLLRPGATLNWQGGELRLTATVLAFVPHALNVGPVEKAVVKLADIAGLTLTRGLVSDEISLTDARGEMWGVRVSSGAEVFDEIQAARGVGATSTS